MSQHNLYTIIRQQQEQLVAMQAQLQALAKRRVGGTGVAVARPQVFDGTPAEVSGFITACRLYIRMKMREIIVEEQIQWILSYV